MTSDADHPFVTQFLRQFDEGAVSLASARRVELREEIAAHLRELVQADMSDKDAAAALSRFRSSAEILGQELDGSPSDRAPAGRSRRIRRTVLILISAVAAAVLLIVLLGWLFLVPASVSPSSPTGTAEEPTSVVNATQKAPPG